MALNVGSNSLLHSTTSRDSLDYDGLPPELASEAQALTRKQQMASYLMQQGLQPAQGQMVGGWYVPPSPMQGLAGLAQIYAGKHLSEKNDETRRGLAGQNKTMLAEAMQGYQESLKDRAVPQPRQGPGAPVAAATANEWVNTLTPGEHADGRIAQELARGGPGMVQEGPSPDVANPGAPMMVPRTADEKRQAIIDKLSLNAHPQAQRVGQLLLGELDRSEAREDTQTFQTEQNKLNRENRIEIAQGQMGRDMILATISGASKETLEAMKAQNDRIIEGMRGKNQAQGGKPPQGYRVTPDGNLEAIKGGPADLKQQGKREQAQTGLQSMTSDLDRLAVSANQIMNHPGLVGITGLRGAVPDVPGTQAADARALLNKLKSQVGFSVLQNMRNNSKSGGALGNVSDNEGKRLENNLASVETAQGIDQMKQELQGIIDYAKGSKDRLSAAYESTYGEGTPAADPPGLPSGATQIGTSNGKPVYQLPDGSKVIAD